MRPAGRADHQPLAALALALVLLLLLAAPYALAGAPALAWDPGVCADDDDGLPLENLLGGVVAVAPAPTPALSSTALPGDRSPSRATRSPRSAPSRGPPLF